MRTYKMIVFGKYFLSIRNSKTFHNISFLSQLYDSLVYTPTACMRKISKPEVFKLFLHMFFG